MLRALVGSLVLLALAAPAARAADPPDVVRVTPLARDGEVYVTFTLDGGVTDEVRETIASGLQTAFVYEFELRRHVPMWVDRTIATATVTASVQYDNLTRRHQLSRSVDGRVEAARVTEDASEVPRWLTTFDRLPIFSTSDLEPNSEVLRARSRPRPAAQHLVSPAVGPWRRLGTRQVHVPALT